MPPGPAQRRLAPLLLIACALTSAGCNASKRPTESDASATLPAPVPSSSVVPTPPSASTPIAQPEPQVESVDVPNDLPAFVVRASRGATGRIAFLHGLCGAAQYYADSFRRAASAHGTLVAIQGNVPCGGEVYRDWSNPPEKVHARIEAAFKAAGDPGPLENMTLIGYSSGGIYAEILAMRWPERYSHLILMALPNPTAVYRLRKAHAIVMIAPEIDRQDLMREGARDLRNAGIPATFLLLPKATHGGMGKEPERVMSEALDFLAAPHGDR